MVLLLLLSFLILKHEFSSCIVCIMIVESNYSSNKCKLTQALMCRVFRTQKKHWWPTWETVIFSTTSRIWSGTGCSLPLSLRSGCSHKAPQTLHLILFNANFCYFFFSVAKCKPQEQQRWTDAQVRLLLIKRSILNHGIIFFWHLVFTTWSLSVQHRFVRRLLYFYKPSSKLYAGLALDHSKARQLTVVGCQFVEFLMDSDEVREVHTYTQFSII